MKTLTHYDMIAEMADEVDFLGPAAKEHAHAVLVGYLLGNPAGYLDMAETDPCAPGGCRDLAKNALSTMCEVALGNAPGTETAPAYLH